MIKESIPNAYSEWNKENTKHPDFSVKELIDILDNLIAVSE